MKLPRIKKSAPPDGFCRSPGCKVALGPTNTSGVCKDHMHRVPFCQCLYCKNGRSHVRLRVRTRDEMVKLGLLPA